MSTKPGLCSGAHGRKPSFAERLSPSHSKERMVRFLSIKPIVDADPQCADTSRRRQWFTPIRPRLQQELGWGIWKAKSPNAAFVDGRASVRGYLRETSVVYSKKTRPPAGARLGQRQVTELRLKDWDRYQWTLPSLQTAAAPSRNHRQPHSHRHQRRHQEGPVAMSDSTLRGGAETSRTLPPLSRSALGQPILRRPATQQSAATSHFGDELLDMLGNYLDLRPISGIGGGHSKDPVFAGGSSAFYSNHFPLLMQKKTFSENPPVEEDYKVVSQRHMMKRLSGEERRRADISRRCTSLERALTTLERGTAEEGDGARMEEEKAEVEKGEEGFFVTELREETFDPRSWPWNTERYQY